MNEQERKRLYNEFFNEGGFTYAGCLSKRCCLDLISMASNPLDLLREFQSGEDSESTQRNENYRNFDRRFRQKFSEEIEFFEAVDRLLDSFNRKIRKGKWTEKKGEYNKKKTAFLESRFAMKTANEILAEHKDELGMKKSALNELIAHTHSSVIEMMATGQYSEEIDYDFTSDEAVAIAKRLCDEVSNIKNENALKIVRTMEKGVEATEKYGYLSIDEGLSEIETRIREIRGDVGRERADSFSYEKLDTTILMDENKRRLHVSAQRAPRCKGYELVINGRIAGRAAAPEFVIDIEHPFEGGYCVMTSTSVQ